MQTEIAQKTNFSLLRYGRCYEDADVLLEGLDIKESDICLSIASVGDNTLALAAQSPQKIVAVDLSFAQIAALNVRIAAFKMLDYHEVLELLGFRPSAQRAALFSKLRWQLDEKTLDYWCMRAEEIDKGIVNCGKMENYFRMFRESILPCIHSEQIIEEIFIKRTGTERGVWYSKTWNSWRWRTMFHVFFSRVVLGYFGRDPAFFTYVKENDVADIFLTRIESAVTRLDPCNNPYLQGILLGEKAQSLPYAFREENFEKIRRNVHTIEPFHGSIEEYLTLNKEVCFNKANLSNIFEYISQENYETLLTEIINHCKPQAKLLYWNLLVPRETPESLALKIKENKTLCEKLEKEDKMAIYSKIILQEVL